jgi:hypothetical protein
MSLASGDLTTLQRLKQWLGITSSDADSLLARLITSASRFALITIQIKSVARTACSEVYDGYGQTFMVLRNWPIIEVTQVLCGGGGSLDIPESTGIPPENGFYIDPYQGPGYQSQVLNLIGYCFPRGRAAVFVQYFAGFQIDNEPQTIPAVSAYTVNTLNLWAGGVEVLRAGTLAPFVLVEATPGANEYTISDDGLYTFNVADAGVDVLITYSYVPSPIEQAVIELVSQGFKYKDRIGINSKTLAGGVTETVAFDNSFLTTRVSSLLDGYRRVSPI